MGKTTKGILIGLLCLAVLTTTIFVGGFIVSYGIWNPSPETVAAILFSIAVVSALLGFDMAKESKIKRNFGNTIVGILVGILCFEVLAVASIVALAIFENNHWWWQIHFTPEVAIVMAILYAVASAFLGFDVAKKSERAEVIAFVLVWFIVLALSYSFSLVYPVLMGLVWFLIFFAAVCLLYYLKRVLRIKRESSPDILE